ncbi:hypothetical protein MBAV_002238 [Candidatus Magnetobacterium bavaricum]|uniref:Uncharacterized protein n=1 Tax=Candidatus Magnetobacterium bavaricum TaxID=29290 RepID=A0A0F3GXY4_9BACT|nr:hypothetical protein MBAV_002238 [Candidatus Magnetobacterium bavaricum]
MKRITLSDCFISFMITFKRSSNCPLYFVPAMRAPRSREMIRFPIRFSGTSALFIFCARPSTIAVLPTPGSPTTMGLFFILRPSIWSIRSISSSRPTTGSSCSSWAIEVRSLPNSFSAGVEVFLVFEKACARMERFIVNCLAPRRFAPRVLNIFPPIPSSSRISPSNRCSLPI